VGIALSPSTHPGVELAAAEINAAGGVRGLPVELKGLEWRTNAFQPAAILDWAERFAATPDLVAVVGHSDSASTLSAAAVYNQRGLPQLVTIATHPAITNIGEWTYRLCVSDSRQGPALADYAVGQWGKKRIAVFYVNDDYGRGLARLFEQRVGELGGTIAASVLHRNILGPDDRELIRAALARLTAEGEPDLFALFQRVGAADWTVEAIREAGFAAPILGGDNLGRAAFLEGDPGLKNGIRTSQFFFPEPGDPRTQGFMESYQRLAGEPPDYGSAFAYDALYLLRDAVLSGGPSRRGVKAYLDRLIADKTVVEGVAGSYSLGADHDARRAFQVVEIRDGRFVFRAVLAAE